MSQIYKTVSSAPAVPTSFVTDSGPAVPAANVLNILADDTTANNANGLTTIGAGNTVTILITNRLRGTGTTVGAATADLVTFSLGASAAVYRFFYEVVGRDTGTGNGVGYTITSTFQTDGAAATRINTPFSEDDEAAALVASGVDMVASGNSAVIRVTGTAGQTISWLAVGEYIVV